jgi:hypothetical protein
MMPYNLVDSRYTAFILRAEEQVERRKLYGCKEERVGAACRWVEQIHAVA